MKSENQELVMSTHFFFPQTDGNTIYYIESTMLGMVMGIAQRERKRDDGKKRREKG